MATQDTVTGAQFLDISWAGHQFVAVGTSVVTDGGVFLASRDGRTWRSQSSGRADGFPRWVAARGGDVVAIGMIADRPSSWVSSDGTHWAWRVGAFPAPLDAGDVATVTDVVATATGWLAVGRVDPECHVACYQAPRRALSWTSTDGLTWTVSRDQPSLTGGGMTGVAATVDGFVAVGTAGGHAAVWWSADGMTWARVPDDPLFGPPAGSASSAFVWAQGVAAARGSVVMVGEAFGVGDGGAPRVLAWRSDDGRAWTAAPVERADTGQVFSVAATAGRFLATGPSGDTSCHGGIWSSVDGVAWSCEGMDPALFQFGPYAAAGSPTVEVAVGLTPKGWDTSTGRGLPGAVFWRAVP